MLWRQLYFILQTLSIWVVRWQDLHEKHFITSGNVMLQFLPSKALNIHKTLSWQPNKICRVCRLHIYGFSLISLWMAMSIHLCIFNIFHIYVYWCFLYLLEYAWMFFQNGVYKCLRQHLACVSLAHIFQFSISYKKIIKQIS